MPVLNRKIPRPADVQVGARIRQLRMLRGLSQERLADHCGITFQQIQKYEKGTNRVGASRLIEIAEALHVQPADLLDTVQTEKTEAAPPPLNLSREELQIITALRAHPRLIGPVRNLLEAAAPLEAA